MKQRFSKPALSSDQQIALLQERGMHIESHRRAVVRLRHLGYYRLAAYWRTFEAPGETRRFVPGTTFDAILRLYDFDRAMRLLLLDGLEQIEISIRANWAYQIATRHGPHALLDRGLTHRQDRWEGLIQKTARELERSDEALVAHHASAYTEEMPPVWVVCEVMSLGTLSQWFNNFGPIGTRAAVARLYGANENLLASWLRHLTLLRNTVAHHARIWNREFPILPMLPRSRPEQLVQACLPGSRRLYNSLCIILYLLDSIEPSHDWRDRLLNLLNSQPDYHSPMGFPLNWHTHTLWRSSPR